LALCIFVSTARGAGFQACAPFSKTAPPKTWKPHIEARQSWSALALCIFVSTARGAGFQACAPFSKTAPPKTWKPNIEARQSWSALALCIFVSTAPAQDQTGALTSIVTDAISHQPVRKAVVRLNPMFTRGQQQPNQRAAATDAAGSFTLTNVSPGRHSLTITHPGYPQGAQKQIEVKPGEKTSLDAVLIPGASITGRFLDEDGDPLPGCMVQLHPARHPEQGAPVQGGVGLTEEGEYRLHGIRAGKYVLSAQCQRPVFQPRPFSSGPDPPPSAAYPIQFYPLAPDAKSAEVIELFAGTEKIGLDFEMKPAPVTHIHGRFSPTGAEWNSGGPFNVQLIPAEKSAQPMAVGAQVDATKGTFDFRQVFPGSYILVANFGDGDHQAGAFQRVEVKDQPLDLVVELRRSIEISGTVEIELNTALNNTPKNSVQVQLMTDVYPNHRGGAIAQVKEDGTFTLSPIFPGVWRLIVNTPMGFMKSAWLGTENVTDRPLDLSSGGAGPLRIVISTKVARIEGTVPQGYLVLAEPVGENLRWRGPVAAGTDETGHFTMGNLAPGTYRLVAVVNGGEMPEEGGQKVTVREGETVTVDLKPQL
jgi:hypothetical protein